MIKAKFLLMYSHFHRPILSKKCWPDWVEGKFLVLQWWRCLILMHLLNHDSVCQSVPGLSAVLLPRLNPFVIFLTFETIFTLVAEFFVGVYESDFADTIFGFMLSILMIVTVYPLASFTGKILLQTTPVHMISHLDKCLREASTMDGVLEFRNEHFWALGYNNIVGTIHVRVRRDANEQVVLSHLTNRLSNLVSDLTIQVFKDEWSWQPSPSRLLRQDQSLLKYSLPSSVSPTSLGSSTSLLTAVPSSISVPMSSSTTSNVGIGLNSSMSGLPVSTGSIRNNNHSGNNHVKEWLQNVWWPHFWYKPPSLGNKLPMLSTRTTTEHLSHRTSTPTHRGYTRGLTW